jgi:hypothetical protein
MPRRDPEAAASGIQDLSLFMLKRLYARLFPKRLRILHTVLPL